MMAVLKEIPDAQQQIISVLYNFENHASLESKLHFN
jgi:hypothetical protein